MDQESPFSENAQIVEREVVRTQRADANFNGRRSSHYDR
jgi:hypothetical protein